MAVVLVVNMEAVAELEVIDVLLLEKILEAVRLLKLL